MKTLNLSQAFVNIDGTELSGPKGAFTLKELLVNVLGAHQAKSGEEAVEVFTLAQNIYKSEEATMEVSDELFKVVKECVGGATKLYTSLVIGQAVKMLE